MNCTPKCEPFDPTNPNSPTVTYYGEADGADVDCIPVCNVNPAIIDNDPVMDRMLENTDAAAGTIINICNTARNNDTDLSGTKIGAVCDRYFKYTNQ